MSRSGGGDKAHSMRISFDLSTALCFNAHVRCREMSPGRPAYVLAAVLYENGPASSLPRHLPVWREG
jgi:hypothetical protein